MRVKIHLKVSLVKTQKCHPNKTLTTPKTQTAWHLLIIPIKSDLFVFSKEFRHVSFTSSLCRSRLDPELWLG
jgi:hypothetical protein